MSGAPAATSEESDNPDPNACLVPKAVGLGHLMANLTTGTLALPPPPKAQSSDTDLTPGSRVRRLMNQAVFGSRNSGDGPRPLTFSNH
eukprot:4918798-Amphidinium_carterae.1